MKRVVVPYDRARPLIKDGDLLQFRPRPWSLVSRAICVAGRSPHSHSGMAGWIDGSLYCLEVREFIGGRRKRLSEYVVSHPRCIDVFRPCSVLVRPAAATGTTFVEEFNGARAVEEMMKFINGDYGYFNLALAALRHIPFVRWWVPLETDLRPNNKPPFCSQAVKEAYRRAYSDPVPNTPSRLTEPGDLTRSALLGNYLFTLG